MALLESIVVQPEGVRIPAHVRDLRAFRAWTHAEAFPDTGRIDWIGGSLEIDVSPERLNSHGTLKTAISRDVSTIVEGEDLGVVLSDRTRYVNVRADLSAEPDVVAILFDTLETGRARLVPSTADPPDYVEIEGAADLVVEVVSPSSVEKDTRRLLAAYLRAGVREYWLVDAREKKVAFTLHVRTGRSFTPARPDARGFRRSKVLDRGVRIVARPARADVVRYRVEFRGRR